MALTPMQAAPVWTWKNLPVSPGFSSSSGPMSPLVQGYEKPLSAYLDDPVGRLSRILLGVIEHSHYEPIPGSESLLNTIYNDILFNDRMPSAADRAALLRLAWKCRAILPPELATYAALGGGTEEDGNARDGQ